MQMMSRMESIDATPIEFKQHATSEKKRFSKPIVDTGARVTRPRTYRYIPRQLEIHRHWRAWIYSGALNAIYKG